MGIYILTIDGKEHIVKANGDSAVWSISHRDFFIEKTGPDAYDVYLIVGQLGSGDDIAAAKFQEGVTEQLLRQGFPQYFKGK